MKVGESLQPPVPLFDQYLMHLGGSIPPHAIVDLVDIIVLTLILTLIDIGLRLLVECIKYNVKIERDATLINLIKTLWQGWKPVNGVRYLASDNLRKQTIDKLFKTHLPLFLLAMAGYLIPDRITVLGIQSDEFVAHAFMLMPLVFEIASIIENIQLIDVEGSSTLKRIVSYINSIRKG